MAGKPYGPYSVAQVRQMGEALGIPVDVQTAAVASDDTEGFGERLLEGRPQVLLVKSSPTFGHYILLMGRAFDASGTPIRHRAVRLAGDRGENSAGLLAGRGGQRNEWESARLVRASLIGAQAGPWGHTVFQQLALATEDDQHLCASSFSESHERARRAPGGIHEARL